MEAPVVRGECKCVFDKVRFGAVVVVEGCGGGNPGSRDCCVCVCVGLSGVSDLAIARMSVVVWLLLV